MSWVTIIWSMIAATCFTLGGVQLFVWIRNRSAWSYLAFATAAFAMACVVLLEFLLMRATTPEEFGTALRWSNVPLTLMITGIMGFVHATFRTGRLWLAGTAVGLRLLVQVLHFTTGQTISHREIIALGQIDFLGEPVSVVARAVTNPWAVVPSLSNLVVLVYLVDATIRRVRMSDPEQRAHAWWLGGNLAGFMLCASLSAVLVNFQVMRIPYFVSIPFVVVLLVMCHDLGSSLLRSQQIDRELTRSRDELRESERRLKLAADSADLGFWSWNLATNIIWSTDRVKSMFSFAPETEITFEMAMARVHPEDRAMVQAVIAESLAARSGLRAEFRLLLTSGQLTWIGAHGDMTLDQQGNPATMTGVVIDITERRTSELAIAEQRNELAHLSRMSMLGELSGSFAHELNQPLTAILSNAQAAQRLLAQTPPALKEVGEILVDIVAEDKRAGDVIRGLRSLLKRGEVQLESLDVNDLVSQTLKLVRSDCANHGVTVHTELAPALPVVAGDRVQFQQVLINLLMNACDAMAGVGGQDRQIRITTAGDGVGGIRISVTDQGPGIDPRKLERIFEPFYTDKPAGMGLGLAVCRTIVTAHGGKLWAGNNPEGGAAFHFTLPLKGPDLAARGAAAKAQRERFNHSSAEPGVKA